MITGTHGRAPPFKRISVLTASCTIIPAPMSVISGRMLRAKPLSGCRPAMAAIHAAAIASGALPASRVDSILHNVLPHRNGRWPTILATRMPAHCNRVAHCLASSTALRNVGKIFAESGKTITVNLYPSNTTPNLTVNLYNSGGTQVQTVSGTGNLTLTYSPGSTGVYEIRVKNTSASNPAQHVFVKATYTAPKTASTATYPMAVVRQPGTVAVPWNYMNWPETRPRCENTSRISFELKQPGYTTLGIYNINGQLVETLVQKNLPAGKHYFNWNAGRSCYRCLHSPLEQQCRH